MIQFISRTMVWAGLFISTSGFSAPSATIAQELNWDGLLPNKYWSSTEPNEQLLRQFTLFNQITSQIEKLEKEFAEKGLEFLAEHEKAGLEKLRNQYSAPSERAFLYEKRGVGAPYTGGQAIDDQMILAGKLIPATEKLLGEKFALVAQRIGQKFNRKFALTDEDFTGLSDPVLASALGLTTDQKLHISRLLGDQKGSFTKSMRELADALHRIRNDIREKMLARLKSDKREYYLRVFGDPIEPFDMIGINGQGELNSVLSMYGQTDGDPVQPLWVSSAPPAGSPPGSRSAWDFLKSMGSRERKKASTSLGTETVKIELLECSLISSEIVRKELKLGDETLQAIRKTLTEAHVNVESWEIDRDVRLVELLDEEETAASAFTFHLTAEQLKRFRQIEIQARTFKDARSFGILDPAVATCLELTEEDRQYIAELAATGETKMKEQVEEHGIKEREKAATLVISLREVLTDPQVERYRYYLGPGIF